MDLNAGSTTDSNMEDDKLDVSEFFVRPPTPENDPFNFPVSLHDFKTYTYCYHVVDELIRRRGRSVHNDQQRLMLDSDELRECVLVNYYRAFFTQPVVRENYQLQMKPCQAFVMEKIMQKAEVKGAGSETVVQRQSLLGTPLRSAERNELPISLLAMIDADDVEEETNVIENIFRLLSRTMPTEVDLTTPQQTEDGPSASSSRLSITQSEPSSDIAQGVEPPQLTPYVQTSNATCLNCEINAEFPCMYKFPVSSDDEKDLPVTFETFESNTTVRQVATVELKKKMTQGEPSEETVLQLARSLYITFYKFPENRKIYPLLSLRLRTNTSSEGECLTDHIFRKKHRVLSESFTLETIAAKLPSCEDHNAICNRIKKEILHIAPATTLTEDEQCIEQNEKIKVAQLANMGLNDLFLTNPMPFYFLSSMINNCYGRKRLILIAVLNMPVKEFIKHAYLQVSDGHTVYNYRNAGILLRCKELIACKPHVWPKNLYVQLAGLIEYLSMRGMALYRADLEHISPKLLHFADIVSCTDFDKCMRSDYLRRNMGLMPSVVSDNVELLRQDYLHRCCEKDEWIWSVPRITDEILYAQVRDAQEAKKDVGIEEETQMVSEPLNKSPTEEAAPTISPVDLVSIEDGDSVNSGSGVINPASEKVTRMSNAAVANFLIIQNITHVQNNQTIDSTTSDAIKEIKLETMPLNNLQFIQDETTDEILCTNICGSEEDIAIADASNLSCSMEGSCSPITSENDVQSTVLPSNTSTIMPTPTTTEPPPATTASLTPPRNILRNILRLATNWAFGKKNTETGVATNNLPSDSDSENELM